MSSKKAVDTMTDKTIPDMLVKHNLSDGLLKNKFCEQIDKNMIQSALKTVKKDSSKKESSKINQKRAKKVDETFEKQFRDKLSIHDEQEGPLSNELKEAQQGSKALQLGNARQKLDDEGNSLKIQKNLIQKRQVAPMIQSTIKEHGEMKQKEFTTGIKYEGSRDIVGVEKSLKHINFTKSDFMQTAKKQ